MDQKNKEYLAAVGLSQDRIDQIAADIEERRNKGAAEGRRTKEAEDTPVVAETPVVVETPVTPETPVTQVAGEVSLKEVTEAFLFVNKQMADQIKAVVDELAVIKSQLASFQTETADKAAQIVAETPVLSLKELYAMSVFGDAAAQVDGRSKLGQDRPVENKDAAAPVFTGVSFLDQVIRNGLTN